MWIIGKRYIKARSECPKKRIKLGLKTIYDFYEKSFM